MVDRAGQGGMQYNILAGEGNVPGVKGGVPRVEPAPGDLWLPPLQLWEAAPEPGSVRRLTRQLVVPDQGHRSIDVQSVGARL